MDMAPAAPNRETKNPYLSASKVAQLTGFSPKSLEAMRYRRTGPPFFRIGNRIRYRHSDVIAFMEQERVECRI